MYTLSSKLKIFSIFLMLVGLLGIGYSFFSAPKTTEEVEKILEADAHGEHGNAHGATAHEAHGKDAKADAEHQEHLKHVLHQLQNKPWAALYVACIILYVNFTRSLSILWYSKCSSSRMVT